MKSFVVVANFVLTGIEARNGKGRRETSLCSIRKT